MYFPLEQLDQFSFLLDCPRDEIGNELVAAAKEFDEENDLEKMILRCINDPNKTPHGPSEIADVLTHHVTFRGNRGLCGFILKGRSFRNINPATVSHQIYKLRKMPGLSFIVLGYTGTLQDTAREEFVSTANDIEVDYSFMDVVDFARLAVSLGLVCPRDANRISDGKCICGYVPSAQELNFLQKEAVKEFEKTIVAGEKAGLIVMPTGSGKTRIAALIAKRLEAERILYVAHTHEILDGANSEFTHTFGTGLAHRNLESQDDQETPYICLSTIQSIRESSRDLSDFDYVVIDEFHHAAAKSYRDLLSRIEPKFMLGLTATPFRGDRQDILGLCNRNIIVEFELRLGIESGILSPFHYYGLFDNVDYSRLRQSNSGYSIQDLNRYLLVPERDDAIVGKWYEHARNKPTLAFCCSIEHAKRMVQVFKNNGVPAREYIGDTPHKERRNSVRDLQLGNIKVLFAVDVLNEGIDLPFVQALMFLRPTESRRIFFQQLGRGLRKSSGKSEVTVLDFIGNFQNAYRILEYLGLDPTEALDNVIFNPKRKKKRLLDFPTGCKVQFEQHVIDVFANQMLDASKATRFNIASILILHYRLTASRLGKKPSRADVRRYQILHPGLYEQVFGSWEEFEKIIEDEVLVSNIVHPSKLINLYE